MSHSPFNEVDVEANRSAKKWTNSELCGRILWSLVYPLFRCTPRPLWWWRNWLLRCFGAKIGKAVRISASTRIEIPWHLSIGDHVGIGDRVILYSLGHITIGSRATVSQGAHLCAGSHNFRQPTMPLLKLPIKIGTDVWICADAFIGPGAVVEELAVVGARAVVTSVVPSNSVVAGNPAKMIGTRF